MHTFFSRARHRALAFFVFLSAVVSGSAFAADQASEAPLVFSITDDGVTMGTGGFGNLLLQPAVLSARGGGDQRPVFSRISAGEGRSTYRDGAEVVYRVENEGRILRVSYTNKPDFRGSLKFSVNFPLRMNKGGRHAIGDGEPAFIPEAHTGQFVSRGHGESFTLVDPTNIGFTLKTPRAYHQLQDNRTFDWAIYSHTFFVDITGRASGDMTFSLERWKPVSGEEARRFLVDRYGQSALKDYPGKVRSDDELRRDIEFQSAALPKMGGPALDGYGGQAGSGKELGLRATGFFHVAEVGDRQVLVTPEGNAFFQISVCGLHNIDDYTLVRGRERTYEWIPPAEGEFATAWRRGTPGVFSFQIANWIRKYGRPYDQDEWLRQSIERLRAWGFNSSGAFSIANAATQELRFPYTPQLAIENAAGARRLPDRIGASHLIDPFAPETVAAIEKAFSESLPRSADNPLIIGYFLGNEQHFQNLPRLIPGYKSDVVAKVRLVLMLKEKYGDIAAFNAAWAPSEPFADFDSLKDASLFVRTEAGAADMLAFQNLYLETYYKLIHDTFRKYNKNHLLIGSRWTPNTSGYENIVRIGGKYLDVVSVNYYGYGIDREFLGRVHAWSGGRPILLSEWHYGSPENGLGGGAIEVATLADRGRAYRNYIEQAAALPFVVGSQWFIYTDQSITGRFFQGFHGEGGNTGLVDVADRPYEDLVTAAKESNDGIYDVMFGRREPYLFEDPRFTSKTKGDAQRVVRVQCAPEGIALDGSTTNWPGVPAETVESSRLVGGLPNPTLRADFRLCWDEKNLYLHAQVRDSTPMQNLQGPTGLWSGDGVELFIGGKDLDTSTGILFDDRQVLLGAGEEAKVFVGRAGSNADGLRLAAECRVTVVRDVSGDGYALVAVMPWSIFGVVPENGREFRFDLAVNNSDNGRLRLQQLMWNGTKENSNHRAAWGRARLVTN